jgi:acyl-CoA synthetase (AMP-forming)/AMP-acid ligase II
MLLHHLLGHGAARHPDKTALGWVKRDRSLSYAEAAAATDRVAAGLAALGVARGDRVGVFAHSGLDYLLAMFGAWRAGAVSALVDLSYADELDAYLGDCAPKVVIYTHDYLDAIDRHRAALPSVEAYVCFDGAQPGAMDWAEILGCADSPPREVAEENDIAHLSYAPDPDGRPMGTALSHGPAKRAAAALAGRLGIAAGDVSLGATPLSGSYHLLGNLLPALSAGATCWVMNSWEDESGLDVVEQLGATVLAANPAVLTGALAEARHRDGGFPSSLRLAIWGDGSLPPELERAWRDEVAVPLAESYGPSELAGLVEPWPAGDRKTET